MKHERISESSEEEGLFSTHVELGTLGTEYSATWGMKCHGITQEITEQVEAEIQVYEAGSLFLSRFPHYMAYMAEEADLIVYVVSIDFEAEST